MEPVAKSAPEAVKNDLPNEKAEAAARSLDVASPPSVVKASMMARGKADLAEVHKPSEGVNNNGTLKKNKSSSSSPSKSSTLKRRKLHAKDRRGSRGSRGSIGSLSVSLKSLMGIPPQISPKHRQVS